ncbi:MAG: tryptophan synthase subunit alpha [Tenacibaculum sp.]
MNSLEKLFLKKDKNLLSIFFTAGFPNLHDTVTIINELSNNDVDFIEVGLPYSDPLADGTTIQHSSSVALKNGMNLDLAFKQLQTLNNNSIPLVAMGYLNQIMRYGEETFCKMLKACHIDTLIIPDLPLYEYEVYYKGLFDKYGLNMVFLITPQTSEDRIRKIDKLTKTFIYVVAASAITGFKKEVSKEQISYFKRIKNMHLQSKLIIGFGIHNCKTFNTACKYANGAIIGSAFINELNKSGICGIANFVNRLKAIK